MRLVLDVETSTYGKGHPFDPRNIFVSYALKTDSIPTSFHYFSDPGFMDGIISLLDTVNELVGFNIKFDLHWLANRGISDWSTVRIWDCSLAEFVISGQQARFISLNEALESYGEPRKPDLVADYWARGISTEFIPIDILEEYNKYDVEGTYILQRLQQQLMSPEEINLVYLMGEDLKALQHAEHAGIKFDVSKAGSRCGTLTRELDEINSQLSKFLPDSIPNPPGFNFDSGDQLSAFLYGGEIEYEYPVPEESVYKSGPKVGEYYVKNRWHRHTVQFKQQFKPIEDSEIKKTKDRSPQETHFYQTDGPTLKQLQVKTKIQKSIIQTLQSRADKIKVKEMIESIINKSNEMHWENNMIHAQFNQNVAVTGRLSSSAPNMQNTPEEVDELLVSRYVD